MSLVDILRLSISAIIVAFISFGNTIQASISGLQPGQEPTKWQIYSAIIGGIVLGLNEIKSRLTPSPTREVAIVTAESTSTER